MEGVRAALDLGEPSSISPDATVEFTLAYENRNHDSTHRLGTVTLSPTWNLDRERTIEVDEEVPPRTRQSVVQTSFETPAGLGGKQGIQVSFGVEATGEDGTVESDHRYTDSPLTVPVTGARHFQAVVCTAGEGEPTPEVRRLIQDWGFDVYLAEDIQSVRDRFTEFDDSPTLFVGVVPADGTDEQGRQRVSSAAWAASDEANLSVVFTGEGVEVLELPPETSVFACDLTDYLALLRASGPELLVARRGLGTGQTEMLVDLLQRGVNVAKQEPKELLRALAYSSLLTATGTTQAVLDAIEVPEELIVEKKTNLVTGHTADSWPMRGANPANTGRHSQQSGPKNDVSTQWSAETDDLVSAPVVSDGTVYFGSFDEKVYTLDTHTGEEQWSFETEGPVSSPVVADGTVYIGSNPIGHNDNKLYALDTLTGRKRWVNDIKGEVESSPVVADGTVYVGSHDENVYALDASTGRERWSVKTGGVVLSSPSVAYDTVYVGSNDNNVYALDTSTGKKKWAVDTGYRVRSSPAVVDGIVYVGSNDGTMYALDASTGRERWAIETNVMISHSPAVVDSTVYVRSSDTIFSITNK